jgi:serine/threonine protein kinase
MDTVSCPRCAHLNSSLEPSCVRCGALLDSSGAISPGVVVEDRYRIEREIGAGAAGRVYEAYDTSLSRRIALKVLSPELIHHRTARTRMAREAQALGKIRHHNVVSINNVFTMGEAHVPT